MTVPAPIVDLAIALGLGLLVGLQRESAEKSVAGLRMPAVPWIVPSGFLSSSLLVATASSSRSGATETADADGDRALILRFSRSGSRRLNIRNQLSSTLARTDATHGAQLR